MTFEDIHRDKAEEIRRLAHCQKVPGLTPEEVAHELTIALWRACETFKSDRGLTIGQWWWVIWIRKKAGLIEEFFRQKPELLVPLNVEVIEALYPLAMPEACPCPTQGEAERVWKLLAQGYRSYEVIPLVGKRRFYQIVSDWRIADVHTLLTT